MKKIFIPIILILIIFAVYLFLSIQGSLTYKDIPKIKMAPAASTKELTTNLINSNEFFTGSINIKYIELEMNSVEIKMLNNSTGDDSIRAEEQIIKAVKKNSKWEITESKVHWKCRNQYFYYFWTTNACP